MSVQEQMPIVVYVANGNTNRFAITFDLHDQNYLVVALNNEVAQVGSYSVLDGEVVFGTAPADGSLVTLYRDTQLNRTTNYKSYDNSFRPESVNWDFDKLWHVLQEQNLIDGKILARIKDEIEWRRTHDFNYDELAQVREKQLFDALKGYSETLLASTNPGVFQGVIAGVVFARDGKSIQTHIEEILDNLAVSREDIDSKAGQQYVDDQLNLKANSSDVYLKSQTYNKSETYSNTEVDTKFSAYVGGRKGYTTLALAQADQANLAANTVVEVTNDGANNGTYQWNGTTLTKSDYDPKVQANLYTDKEISKTNDYADQKTFEAQLAVFGSYKNHANSSIDGYISKTDGSIVSNASWKSTGFISVNADTMLKRIGTLIGSSSSAAAVAMYDADKNFLGIYTDTAATFEIKPTDIFPSARFVRLSIQAASVSTATINVYANNPFIKDFFKSSDAVNGYITLTGAFTPSETWITTPLVPVKVGQKLVYTGRGNEALVASISAFDKNGAFLQSLYASSVESSFNLQINDSNIAYVRATSAMSYAHSLSGFYIPESKSKKYSTIVPTEIYALKNEPIYLYADGIVGNADNVAWNISESNQKVCKVIPSTSASIPVQLQTTEDMNAKKTLASFNVVVTDTPVNPAEKRYIITLGDSLTDGVANAGIQGAWVNECSRRLSGIGRQILDAELSPSPLNLTNLEFIGTRGSNDVKHEGRGGWRASNYLNNASVTSLTNAFWNPATSQFDMSFYLTQNGFTGVNATGSNLTVVILLGWNDVYNSTAKQAAIDLGLLIDKIRSTHPNTDIICLGLNQAPEVNFKSFTGNRFISKREVFESIKQFNDEYKAMIATKSNVDFLQISCVFNSEIGYNKSDFAISSRSIEKISGVADHVHPNATGYAMIADAVFYKLLYKYCR